MVVKKKKNGFRLAKLFTMIQMLIKMVSLVHIILSQLYTWTNGWFHKLHKNVFLLFTSKPNRTLTLT